MRHGMQQLACMPLSVVQGPFGHVLGRQDCPALLSSRCRGRRPPYNSSVGHWREEDAGDLEADRRLGDSSLDSS